MIEAHQAKATNWQRDFYLPSRQGLIITGGSPLSGVVENPGGGKNVVNKLLVASCFGNTPSHITNAPAIGEVKVAARMLSSIGVHVDFSEDKTRVTVNPEEMRPQSIPLEVGRPSRVSLLGLGLLLPKFGKADIPLPGGDKLGHRPIESHIEGMEALGAKKEESSEERVVMTAFDGLRGGSYRFRRVSFMGTENMTLAATTTPGKTFIHNPFPFPEVDELISFLNQGGANIQRIDGPANGSIQIEGVDNLQGVNHELETDITTAVTFGVAALITESKEGILVKKIKPNNIRQFLKLLDEMGGGYEVQEDGIRFFHKDPLIAPKRKLITYVNEYDTSEYLGIRTDWQPLISLLLLKAEGTSTLVETIFSERFQHLDVAQRAGAEIEYFDPREEDPRITFNFQEDGKLHGAKIRGGNKLRPIVTNGGNDIRLGAFCVLLGLMTDGESYMEDLTQVNRGYHRLIDNLKSLDAAIQVEGDQSFKE